MKMWALIAVSIIFLNGCATNDKTPELQNFQTQSLPTGGNDAALTANTM